MDASTLANAEGDEAAAQGAGNADPAADSSEDEKGYESDPEKEIELMKILEKKVPEVPVSEWSERAARGCRSSIMKPRWDSHTRRHSRKCLRCSTCTSRYPPGLSGANC